MDGWRDRAVIVLPLLAALVLIVGRFSASVLPMDEGMSVVYGDLVRRGLVTHRDFQSLYGPGGPWLVAGAYAVLGTAITTERIVAAIVRLALVAGVVVFARGWGRRAAIASGFITVVQLVPVPIYFSPALAAATCALWSLIVLARGRGPFAAGIAGSLGGVALLFRPDYLLVTVAPALVVAARKGAARRGYFLGFVIGIAPLAIHVIVVSPAALLDGVVIDGMRAVASRRLPLPLGDARNAFTLAAVIATLGCTLWLTVRSMRAATRDDRDIEFASYVVLSFLLLPQALARLDAQHLAVIAAVVSPLMVIAFVRLAQHAHLGAGPRLAAFTSALLFYVIVALGVLVVPSRASLVARGERSYPEDIEHGPEIVAIVDAAQPYARPGSRIFIGPADLTRTNYNDTILYFLYPDLVPATFYLEMEPQTANRAGSRLAGDIASADLLILTTRWDGVREPNDSAIAGSPDPVRVVTDHFRLVDREGEYALYVRRSE